MKRLAYFPVILFVITSCGNPAKNERDESVQTLLHPSMERLEWLIGTWKIITPEGQLYEVWTKNNDSLFTGKTCMIINNDTGFTEEITLKMSGNEIFYIPVVNGQNQNQPVSFKLSSDLNGEFIFENPQHDFPQRIIYRNPKPDSLHARIEGNYNGEFRKEEFTLGRD